MSLGRPGTVLLQDVTTKILTNLRLYQLWNIWTSGSDACWRGHSDKEVLFEEFKAAGLLSGCHYSGCSITALGLNVLCVSCPRGYLEPGQLVYISGVTTKGQQLIRHDHAAAIYVGCPSIDSVEIREVLYDGQIQIVGATHISTKWAR